jgi:hypothetical protein
VLLGLAALGLLGGQAFGLRRTQTLFCLRTSQGGLFLRGLFLRSVGLLTFSGGALFFCAYPCGLALGFQCSSSGSPFGLTPRFKLFGGHPGGVGFGTCLCLCLRSSFGFGCTCGSGFALFLLTPQGELFGLFRGLFGGQRDSLGFGFGLRLCLRLCLCLCLCFSLSLGCGLGLCLCLCQCLGLGFGCLCVCRSWRLWRFVRGGFWQRQVGLAVAKALAARAQPSAQHDGQHGGHQGPQQGHIIHLWLAGGTSGITLECPSAPASERSRSLSPGALA